MASGFICTCIGFRLSLTLPVDLIVIFWKLAVLNIFFREIK